MAFQRRALLIGELCMHLTSFSPYTYSCLEFPFENRCEDALLLWKNKQIGRSQLHDTFEGELLV